MTTNYYGRNESRAHLIKPGTVWKRRVTVSRGGRTYEAGSTVVIDKITVVPNQPLKTIVEWRSEGGSRTHESLADNFLTRFVRSDESPLVREPKAEKASRYEELTARLDAFQEQIRSLTNACRARGIVA